MSQDTCRICMGTMRTNFLSNIFRFQESMKISSNIMSIANVTITPNDGLPDKICNMCVNKLNECISFVRLCERSDRKYREVLQKCSENEGTTTEADNMDLSQDMFPECKRVTETDSSNVFMDINQINTKDSNQHDNDLKTSKKKEKQQCSTCGKLMSCRFRLKTHLRTHTEERPYSCPHCSKNFSLAQTLKVHLRTHTGEKPLQCSVCGESFAHSAGLATHKRKHTGQTPYRCVLCPRTFRTVGHLQYHVRRHTGEKNFECDTCGKAFITRSYLKQHFLTHTGDRPHVCSVCGVRWTRSSHLKRHTQRAHAGQFSCNTCLMRFTQKAEYEKHKTSHHGEVRENGENRVVLT